MAKFHPVVVDVVYRLSPRYEEISRMWDLALADMQVNLGIEWDLISVDMGGFEVMVRARKVAEHADRLEEASRDVARLNRKVTSWTVRRKGAVAE